jgi:hypothetical protein
LSRNRNRSRSLINLLHYSVRSNLYKGTCIGTPEHPKRCEITSWRFLSNAILGFPASGICQNGLPHPTFLPGQPAGWSRMCPAVHLTFIGVFRSPHTSYDHCTKTSPLSEKFLRIKAALLRATAYSSTPFLIITHHLQHFSV